jgi:hypothetical protein
LKKILCIEAFGGCEQNDLKYSRHFNEELICVRSDTKPNRCVSDNGLLSKSLARTCFTSNQSFIEIHEKRLSELIVGVLSAQLHRFPLKDCVYLHLHILTHMINEDYCIVNRFAVLHDLVESLYGIED